MSLFIEDNRRDGGHLSHYFGMDMYCPNCHSNVIANLRRDGYLVYCPYCHYGQKLCRHFTLPEALAEFKLLTALA